MTNTAHAVVTRVSHICAHEINPDGSRGRLVVLSTVIKFEWSTVNPQESGYNGNYSASINGLPIKLALECPADVRRRQFNGQVDGAPGVRAGDIAVVVYETSPTPGVNQWKQHSCHGCYMTRGRTLFCAIIAKKWRYRSHAACTCR